MLCVILVVVKLDLDETKGIEERGNGGMCGEQDPDGKSWCSKACEFSSSSSSLSACCPAVSWQGRGWRTGGLVGVSVLFPWQHVPWTLAGNVLGGRTRAPRWEMEIAQSHPERRQR